MWLMCCALFIFGVHPIDKETTVTLNRVPAVFRNAQRAAKHDFMRWLDDVLLSSAVREGGAGRGRNGRMLGLCLGAVG